MEEGGREEGRDQLGLGVLMVAAEWGGSIGEWGQQVGLLPHHKRMENVNNISDNNNILNLGKANKKTYLGCWHNREGSD